MSAVTPAVFFLSIIVNQKKMSLETAVAVGESLIGESLFFMSSFNPSLDYYAKEMGDAEFLCRFFLLSCVPMEREKICELKIKAMGQEREKADLNGRIINIDPGFITLENMCLSSQKNFLHRIYLRDQVFLEQELLFSADRGVIFLPWTYPDYQHKEKVESFQWLRSILLAEIFFARTS